MGKTARPGVATKDPAGAYNLVGQRLGRKGQETRERILSAMLRLLDQNDEAPITLTSVAREASIGMTTLYLYFPDLGDLLLAALARVMESADDSYMNLLRADWPDEELGRYCREFLQAHYQFWDRHTRVLHLRNSFADARDMRFLHYREQQSIPMVESLIAQMRGGASGDDGATASMATVLLMGLERIASIVTNSSFFRRVGEPGRKSGYSDYIDGLIVSEARIMALAIRDERARLLGVGQVLAGGA